MIHMLVRVAVLLPLLSYILTPITTQSDPTKPATTKPEPTQPDPTKLDPTKLDPTQSAPTRPEPTQPSPTKADPTEKEKESSTEKPSFSDYTSSSATAARDPTSPITTTSVHKWATATEVPRDLILGNCNCVIIVINNNYSN